MAKGTFESLKSGEIRQMTSAVLNNVVLAESEVPSVHFSGSGKASKDMKVPKEVINTEADEEIATVKGSPYLKKESA